MTNKNANEVKFYLDFRSPYAYLAQTRFDDIAAATGAVFVPKPIVVIDLMNRVGNTPTSVVCPPKAKYVGQDLIRWAKAYSAPLKFNPAARQIDGPSLLRGVFAAEVHGARDAYCRAVFNAIWTQQVALTDDTSLLEVLQKAGIDAAEHIVAERDDQQASLDAVLEEAIEDGVFGAPSFVYDGALYFGNDRLQFLEADLKAAA
ncbi:2-hydroxychromene-2-carboxylate isomerase [Ruegeria jejuensis]|uniref:2-hydroxychromene-2-carboxylate isomerase n=1 Tax=Ruegeria jejuensis TaxID=3233338 RepID=UPI00355B7D5E